jgi:hypothetical protein
MTDYDKKHRTVDPRGTPNPNDPTMTRLVEQWSVPKFQMGINGGIVLNATQFVHFDIDVFRAQAQWYGANGFAAEKQVVWAYNGGMTVNW